MKHRIIIALALLFAQPGMCAIDNMYQAIEKNNVKAAHNLSFSALFNLSKEEKKALVDAAKKQADLAHLNVHNVTAKDAGRLAIGIPATMVGVPVLAAGIALPIIAAFLDDAERNLKIGMRIASPIALVIGGAFSYIGINNLVKAFNRDDNYQRYCRALAVEAMLKRVKTQPSAVETGV